MSQGNLFGGKNPRGNYTPMSDVEQEALDELRTRGEFVLVVKGIGTIPLENVNIAIGDHRLGIGPFTITFQTEGNRITKIPYLDLVLKTASGMVLFSERQAFKDTNGNPMMVSTGVSVPVIWDIGINKIDPKVVRAILPKVRGLTTRRGNEKFTPEQQRALRELRAGEARARASTKEMVEDSVRKMDEPNSPVSKRLAGT